MTKIINFLKSIFFISVLFLILLSLFPGSLIGFIFYGDLGRQPYLIKNPFGTSINHFITYFYISILGFGVYLRSKNFQNLVYGLLLLAITLEVLQFIVPNRAFEFYDLIFNFLGVLVAYFLVNIYLFLKKP